MLANLLSLRDLTLPEGPAVGDLLPELLAQRLFDAALDEESAPATLHRLAHAYRVAQSAHIAKQRQDAAQIGVMARAEHRKEIGG